MPDNYYSEVNENGVVTPLKDLAAFPRSEQAVLGAKNLLKHIVTTQTIDGVTVTVDDNNVITLNGTSTADIYISVLSQTNLNNLLAKYGDLILNGSHPTEYDNARLITRYGSSNYVIDLGKGVLLDASKTYTIGLSLQIYNGKTFNNHKIYPMLRLASDPDDTYVPYAMTNRELTDRVDNIKYTSNGTSYTVLKQYVVKPTMTFSSGVGTATLYAPAGETIGSFAVACANSDKAVAHVNVSGTTATVTLTDTSYSSTAPVTIIYFTYKS